MQNEKFPPEADAPSVQKIKKALTCRVRLFPHIPHPTSDIVFFVLFALSSLLFVACEEKLKPPVSSTGLAGEIPAQESWNAKITFTDSGRVTAILHAGHIASFAEKKYTLLDSNIRIDFFNEQQQHTSVLTARRGRVDDITHNLEAHENVVVVSDSGTTLRTEDLFWDNSMQRVHSSSFVDITSPTERIQGQGFESDQSLRHYTVFRVTGQAKNESP